MMSVFNLSNFLSILRIPLAFVLIIDISLYRALAIGLAMITDGLDGYLARRFKMTSQLGAFLDPLTDKFFVFFAITIFIHEGNLHLWQAVAMLSRDIAIAIFGGYLALKGTVSDFPFQSIWSGKLTTFIQFSVLLALTFHFFIPFYTFYSFIVLGFFALFELYQIEKSINSKKKIKKKNE